jgi:outer membrane protein assembly factor BamB
MFVVQTDEANRREPLRLWPGVIAVVLQWLCRFVVPVVVPGAVAFAMLGGIFGGLAVVLWWAFLSRAPRSERWGAIVLMIVALVATYFINHESMGQLWLISYAAPTLSLAFVAWAVVGRRLADGPRRVTMVATILVACGAWALVQSHGITGGGAADFAWRWAETPEERLLAQADDEPRALPPVQAGAETEAAWPGFRGPRRDSIIPGVRIETDWSRSPPVELWRRPIGPGWSSFAVHGDLIYTQEQRGDDEAVSCYNASTGEPVWRYQTAARFWESQGGPGPRATPTLGGRRVYTFGATGILNALDSGDGTVVWSRNAASDTGVELPDWGFASSPLVTGDAVIVAVAGALVAYDLESGDPRWFGPAREVSYSSPHLLTIDGVEQVLILHEAGVTSVAPADGMLLWEHAWPGFRIVQPALTADGDLLICSERIGTRRLAVSTGPGGWTIEERWTSTALKPYFSDFVVHDGHAFGFDGSILACIDLEDGERRWKGGRYGHGQLVLLPDQDLLLVVSERGELALVAAVPDKFTELARFSAIEGKTWNHPVLVGGLLLVRNSQEMVAFRLSHAVD